MIETKLDQLIVALEANTAALTAILSAGAAADSAAPVKKPKKAVPENPPAPEAPAPETPAPETPEPVIVPDVVIPAFKSKDDFIAQITEKVRAAFTAAGAGLPEKKAEYETLRKKFGVEKATECTEDQWASFYAEVAKL